MKATPVGVAQQLVLDALGLEADSWQDANRQFEKAGIVVGAKRVGRSSVPVVTVKRYGGGFNRDGEGETWTRGDSTDLTPIRQWIKK